MLLDIVAHPIESNGHEYLKIRSAIDLCVFHSPTQIKVRPLKALWDTGATNTCIPMDPALKMGIPLREETIMHLDTVEQPSRFRSFYLRFSDEHYEFVRDGVAISGSKNRLVIGMDVMKRGMTTITPDGKGGVCFTFEINDNKNTNP